MGLRDALNNNSAVVTIIAVALLVMALGIVVWSLGGSSGGGGSGQSINEKWFLDTTTNKMFTAPVTTTSPTTSPEGNEGVEAMIFTCSDACGAPDLTGKTPEEVAATGLFIGYVQRMNKTGLKKLKEMESQTEGADMAGFMAMEMLAQYGEIREADSKRWYSQGSNKMREINQSLQKRCPERRFPKVCMPGMD